MPKKKICFIAQFPPPMHGLAKAVDTLYNSSLANEFDFEKINITNNKIFLKNLISILKSDADLFYFVISQSIGGNIRDLIILKAIECKRKKCLIHLHGGYFRKLLDNDMNVLQKKLNIKALKKLEGVIVLSPILRKIFEGIVDEKKIHTVANCVDDQFLMSDEEFNRKLKEQRKKKIKNVLYLSNFIKEKGYPEVLELAKLEKERCGNGGERKLHFDFAGKFFNTEDEKYFFDFIKNNELENFVTYHGVVSGDKKRELLKRGDIFILLTCYHIEGQPISILEAMGNGMMIVTTDHAGIPDIVRDEVNGVVVKKDYSTIALYNSINELQIDGFSVLNRNKVMKLYREKRYLSNMNNVFNAILRSNK